MSPLFRRGLALLAALAVLAAAAAPAAASAAGFHTESRFIHVVDGPANDQHISIDTTLYLPAGATAAHPVPAVIGAHGFGENKQALAGVAEFLAGRGYAVLLYSARGFGRSGGEISLDSPSYDVKDVEQLVTWLGTQPEIERDAKGPVVGMFGDSYGGGATLMAAAFDPAIRVAIPILSWNSLISSFLPNDVAPSDPQPGVFKQGWASVFLGGAGGGEASGAGGATAPPSSACPGFVAGICQAYAATADGGQPTPQALVTLSLSSPGTFIGAIKIPTLLIQGEADTLFDLNEAQTTEAAVRANGAPARMVWVPGGHSNLAAILSGSTASVLKTAIASWLDRWLKGDRSVVPGGDRWYDPATGRYLPFSSRTAASRFLLSANGQLVGHGAKAGVVGFANPPGGQPAALSQDPASAFLSTLPSFDIPGQNASFTSPPLGRAIEVVGSPVVRLTVSSSTPDLELFVKLYDVASDATATLPGGQVAPIRLSGLTPGVTQTVTVTLPAIVQRFDPSARLRVVVAATDAAYANLTTATIYRLTVGGGAASLSLPTQPLPPLSGHTAAYAIVAVIVVVGAALIVLTRRRPGAIPLEAVPTGTLPHGSGPQGSGPPGTTPQVALPPGSTGDRPEEAAVVIAHLTKQFRGVRAVDDLSFTIGTGQVFGLLGPNGAGKTTTIRMLLGLVYPTAGACAVFGQRIRPGHPVLGRVGTLVEGPKFVPHLSGFDNLRLFWRAGGAALEDAHIDQALEVAGLGDAVHRPVKTYSQGMRQRLGIAQAMLGQPELMILDEPTNGLDPQQMFEMRQVIRGLAERGITVLLSSHLLGEVEQICSHVAIMDRGRLVAAGTVAELIAGSPTVYVEVDDVEAALPVLEAIGPVRREGSGLVVELAGTPPAAVARALVSAGVGLSAMTPRRHLEDVFIGLIEGERSAGVSP